MYFAVLMKVSILLFIFFLFISTAKAQSNFSGNVLDATDKKYLEGVSVSIMGKDSAVTNSRGYFSLMGDVGDTLQVSFPGFIEQKLVLGSEKFLLIQIQDEARLLPTFQVKAEPYRFRFKDGKLYLAEDEPEQERRLSQGVSLGSSQNASLTPNVAISGVLSSLTKRNRELRKYEEKLEWTRRRQGYLEVIDSDSVRTDLMKTYQLSREEWDKLIMRFNAFHQGHEFLDWSKDRVADSLTEFVRIETSLDF
jgi:hypothetical protein